MMNTEGQLEARFRPGTWLRWGGALTFLGACVLFLLEGVDDDGALRRELSWAAITVVLSILGIVAARAGRDAAGARVLLGLAAATIPAHFAQVGAQIWGLRVDGIGTLTGVAIGCGVLVAIAPPLSIGISALVRGRGALLTLVLFALSCPLLIASRDGDLVACCVVSEVLVLLLLERLVFRDDPRMKTFEGLSARAMLLLPPAILLVRNAFYAPTTLWAAALFVAPAIVFLSLPHLTRARGPFASALQVLAVIGLAIGASIAMGEPGLVLGLVLSMVGLLGTRALLDEPWAFAATGTAVFLLTSIAAWVSPHTGYALLVVPVGALHVLGAYRSRSLPLLAASGAATVLGLAGQIAPIVRLPSHDRWLVAAIAGITLLALASIVERYRASIERWWTVLASPFVVDAPASPPSAASVEPGATAAPAGPYREAGSST